MFFARFTMSLFSSRALPLSCHFSVSASISEVINFISRPALAIFACSSLSNRTGFSGLLVVPCFWNERILLISHSYPTRNNSNKYIFSFNRFICTQSALIVGWNYYLCVPLVAAKTCKPASLVGFDWVPKHLSLLSSRQSWATATCRRILVKYIKTLNELAIDHYYEFKTYYDIYIPSRFSLAILLVGCLANVCAAVTTWGPYILKLISVNLADTCNDSESATCLRSLHT